MSNRIRAVERAMDILNCFTIQQPEMGVSEIGRKLGLDPGTVCRILLTLQAGGFVHCNPATGKYCIGPRILQLAEIGLGNVDLRARALPHMRWLRDQIDETVALGVRLGPERVYIEQVESRRELRRSVRIGKELPLYCGASGKLLLAHMPDEEVDRLLAGVELERHADATITDPAALREEVRRIRGQGFATSQGEIVSWGAGVAVPVRDHTGGVVAALSVVLPSLRYDPDGVQGLVRPAAVAAGRISAELGAPSNTGSMASWSGATGGGRLSRS